MVGEIKIIGDLLINLLKDRDKDKKRIITDIIDPLYNSIKIVVNEYRKMLSKIIDVSEEWNEKELNKLYKELQVIRNSYITERQSLISLTEIASEKLKDEKLRLFAFDIIALFLYDEESILNGLRKSPGSSILSHFEHLQNNQIDYYTFAKNMALIKYHLEKGFDLISSSYANIKIN